VCHDHGSLFIVNDSQAIGARSPDIRTGTIGALCCRFKWLRGPMRLSHDSPRAFAKLGIRRISPTIRSPDPGIRACSGRGFGVGIESCRAIRHPPMPRVPPDHPRSARPSYQGSPGRLAARDVPRGQPPRPPASRPGLRRASRLYLHHAQHRHWRGYRPPTFTCAAGTTPAVPRPGGTRSSAPGSARTAPRSTPSFTTWFSHGWSATGRSTRSSMRHGHDLPSIPWELSIRPAMRQNCRFWTVCIAQAADLDRAPNGGNARVLIQDLSSLSVVTHGCMTSR
jgi:hypothetical protein